MRTATAFGLRDRGVIQPCYRADLILVGGDPIADIRATHNLQRIRLGGIEYRRPEFRPGPPGRHI